MSFGSEGRSRRRGGSRSPRFVKPTQARDEADHCTIWDVRWTFRIPTTFSISAYQVACNGS
eukprot:6197295-Pleurochrysis_carterae.AAC.4